MTDIGPQGERPDSEEISADFDVVDDVAARNQWADAQRRGLGERELFIRERDAGGPITFEYDADPDPYAKPEGQ